MRPASSTSDVLGAIGLLRGGMPRDAARALLPLARAAPSPAVWTNLGIALECLGRPRRAEAAYARALALDPGHVEARSNLASLELRHGRPWDAERDFARLVAGCGEDADALYGLAHAQLDQGKTAEAV